MAWASDYIGGFLNRLTIADFCIKYGKPCRPKVQLHTASCARDMVVTASWARNMAIRPKHTPQPPELAIWRSGPGTVHIHRSLRSAVRVQVWQHPELAEMTQGGRQAGEGEEGEGPAPLLKSRDPLLAGGEKTCKAQHTRLQHGHIQKQLYNIYDFLPCTQ